MKNINAYVLSGAGDDDVRTFITDVVGGTVVSKIEECNLLVFVGGSDVSPGLYGEQNVHSFTDYARDKFELDLFQFASACGIPMLGICRGAQFLHAAMGGSLWQDVTNHCCQHPLLDIETGDIIDDTTSTHHQMVRMKWDNFDTPDAAGFDLVATPTQRRSAHYESEAGFYDVDGGIQEVEVYRYDRNGTSIMGCQGHPEWGGEEFAGYIARKLIAWHGGIEQEPDVAGYRVVAELTAPEDDAVAVPFDRAAYQAGVAAA